MQPLSPQQLQGQLDAQAQGMADLNLDELGVVISDEIHYINDPERGTVWEETLMHLPQAVQVLLFLLLLVS
jgi:replicative superfamily II helicase